MCTTLHDLIQPYIESSHTSHWKHDFMQTKQVFNNNENMEHDKMIEEMECDLHDSVSLN